VRGSILLFFPGHYTRNFINCFCITINVSFRISGLGVKTKRVDFTFVMVTLDQTTPLVFFLASSSSLAY
jgi:hypothetical protein